jgi:hypothetical protein
MPDEPEQSEEKLKEAEAKFQNLADRLTKAWEKLHPASKKDLDTAREAARDDWKREREAERTEKPAQDAPKHDQKRRGPHH